MINPQAREAFWKMAEQARSRGRDLAEVLDREGFLLTPERHKQIEADVIEEISEILATTSAHHWTGGRGNTQMDLLLAISGKLKILADDRRS